MTTRQINEIFKGGRYSGNKNCPCGSGLDRKEIIDARGIFVTFCCSKCKDEKLSGYRPEIFFDMSYEAYGDCFDYDY